MITNHVLLPFRGKNTISFLDLIEGFIDKQ